MKKILFLFMFSIGILFSMSNNEVLATESNNYPTDTDIKVLNQELEQLVEEVNERLAKGEKNIETSSKNLKIGFKQDELINPYSFSQSKNLNSMAAKGSSIGSKTYQAYVANTKGFNFRHAVHGTFSWKGNYLTAVTGDEDLSGKMYSRSATTKVQGVDGTIGRNAKIGRVTSKGTFTALKYVPISYYTTLVVDVYAPTKSYRIITAKITN
ncbi:hypothetical protein [Bacillus xiapuensis]|uniref:hypothetical protein n=1 Tax=Bacillus xiapuensis TaxID=2014075 RepID=UPI000C23799C|nr:hypothetical protein [Bacillus xiapuensis]